MRGGEYLQQAAFSEGDGLAVGRYDEMIEYADVDQVEGVFQAAGEQFVCRARLGGARWVVVCKNDRGGVMGECQLDDLAGIDRGLG